MLGFNTNKTIQAASHLLKRQPEDRMNYMRLLKHLYLADRLSLERRGTPICGDKPFAMKQGPVMSATLDLIKGRDPASDDWNARIKKTGFDVTLVSDPGNLELSRAEISILDEIAEQFSDLDEWELVDWCHKHLPEFEKNDPTREGLQRKEIPLNDVLDAIGKNGEREAVIKTINESMAFSRLFGDHAPADE